jgi:hypothetical protein
MLDIVVEIVVSLLYSQKQINCHYFSANLAFMKNNNKNKILSVFAKGVSISAHLLHCKSFAVGNYSFSFRRLAYAPNLTHE